MSIGIQPEAVNKPAKDQRLLCRTILAMTFTGRIVGAEEALKIGIVTLLCEDPLAEAEKTAREIAGKTPPIGSGLFQRSYC